MKKKLITGISLIFALFLVIYFQSCKRDSTNLSTDLTNKDYFYKKDSLFAPLSLAIQIAENVNKSNIVLKTVTKNNLKSALYLGKRKIKNNLTISDKNKTPYFYVLNYESGGFVVISADKRSIPIVGYSEKGNFKIDSLPLGLIKWFEQYANYINHLRTSSSKPSGYVNYQWENMSCDESLLKSTSGYECPPPPPSYTETTVTVGPLLTTSWNQDCGYNTYCPVASDGPCGYALTGCTATAMAQIMAYWKYPSSYNWSQMPLNYGNDNIALLMKDVGYAIYTTYGGNGSSAYSTNIVPAFKNVFLYSSANFSDYDVSSYATVVANLNNNQPVLLTGCNDQSTILGIPYSWSSCHAWVCDGYMQTTYYQNGVETSQYLAFDMNWGWGGAYNGWFAFNYWNLPDGTNFQYGTEMVYNIHP
ncbi:MAG: C10 family peptidase [Bacteroidota bacterium]|nr:C10 family peptidase [Bacteroidota bacterium]